MFKTGCPSIDIAKKLKKTSDKQIDKIYHKGDEGFYFKTESLLLYFSILLQQNLLKYIIKLKEP